MSRIDDLAVLAFQGKDAGVFLHNQLTADVLALARNECTFAALCQPKGRVMALLLVQNTGEGYRVLCHDTLADGLLEYLVRFRFREKVTLEREHGLAVLWGEAARQAPAVQAHRLDPMPYVSYAVVPEADARGLPVASAAANELSHGIVWLDKQSTEQFLPQMLGQEAIGALNFRKGCFPGQEVIARTRYLGKLKRHPWTGRIKAALPAETLGKVTLAAEDAEASGVVVAQAPYEDGTQQLFVVARRPGAIDVCRAQTEDAVIDVLEGRWLSPDDNVGDDNGDDIGDKNGDDDQATAEAN